jgi:hypothetical protein
MHDDFCKKSCIDFSKIFDNYAVTNPDHKSNLIFDGSTESLDTAVFADNVHLLDKGVEYVGKNLQKILEKIL